MAINLDFTGQRLQRGIVNPAKWDATEPRYEVGDIVQAGDEVLYVCEQVNGNLSFAGLTPIEPGAHAQWQDYWYKLDLNDEVFDLISSQSSQDAQIAAILKSIDSFHRFNLSVPLTRIFNAITNNSAEADSVVGLSSPEFDRQSGRLLLYVATAPNSQVLADFETVFPGESHDHQIALAIDAANFDESFVMVDGQPTETRVYETKEIFYFSYIRHNALGETGITELELALINTSDIDAWAPYSDLPDTPTEANEVFRYKPNNPIFDHAMLFSTAVDTTTFTDVIIDEDLFNKSEADTALATDSKAGTPISHIKDVTGDGENPTLRPVGDILLSSDNTEIIRLLNNTLKSGLEIATFEPQFTIGPVPTKPWQGPGTDVELVVTGTNTANITDTYLTTVTNVTVNGTAVTPTISGSAETAHTVSPISRTITISGNPSKNPESDWSTAAGLLNITVTWSDNHGNPHNGGTTTQLWNRPITDSTIGFNSAHFDQRSKSYDATINLSNADDADNISDLALNGGVQTATYGGGNLGTTVTVSGSDWIYGGTDVSTVWTGNYVRDASTGATGTSTTESFTESLTEATPDALRSFMLTTSNTTTSISRTNIQTTPVADDDVATIAYASGVTLLNDELANSYILNNGNGESAVYFWIVVREDLLSTIMSSSWTIAGDFVSPTTPAVIQSVPIQLGFNANLKNFVAVAFEASKGQTLTINRN